MAMQLSQPLIALGLAAAIMAAPAVARAQNEPQAPPGGYTVQVQVQPGQPPPVVQPPPQQVVVQPGQVVVQPAPGQPPPGQVYYAPPGYYPPPAAGPRKPKKIDWEEGEPIPPGYHTATRVRTGLVAGGASMFGVAYLLSVVVGSVMEDVKHNGYPLLIPVAGPFVEMKYSSYASASVVLALDAIVQAAGLGMLIGGIAAPKTVLVPDVAGVQLVPRPIIGQNNAGFGLVGSF
jgi:hypothetical protein